MENNVETKNRDLSRFLREKEIVEGTVIGLGRSAIYVDLGALGTGIIYGKEFYETKKVLKNLKIGDKLFSKVIELENEDGYVELSSSEAGKELSWDKLQQRKADDETIIVKVLGANKGGLLVEVDKIQGFLPVSQLSTEHFPRVEKGDSAKILQKLQMLIGNEIEVQILDISPREKKLILSEKASEIKKLKEVLKDFKTGDLVSGEITGIVSFGAFMKFGKKGAFNKQIEGLIHISELDWQLIDDPLKIVKLGQKVKAKIIGTTNDGQISLSLKALKKDPWENIEKKYKKGDVVKGKVTKFNPFGSFVEITPKIQGLVHISEFSTETKMKTKLKIGEKYNFQILQIDSKELRMTLKLTK